MRIIAKRTVAEFGARNPSARTSLEHWLRVTNVATWASTNDVQSAFSKAKVLNAERVRFEVAFVKFIGTHAEYDRIDALTVSKF